MKGDKKNIEQAFHDLCELLEEEANKSLNHEVGEIQILHGNSHEVRLILRKTTVSGDDELLDEIDKCISRYIEAKQKFKKITQVMLGDEDEDDDLAMMGTTKCKCGAVLHKTIHWKNKKQFCEGIVLDDCDNFQRENPLKVEVYDCPNCGEHFKVINDFEDEPVKCRTPNCQRLAEDEHDGLCLICYECRDDAIRDAEHERAEIYDM